MKSTHIGTCQICGSQQKLPGGVIALHGYKVQWSNYIGSCNGSGRVPFELSKEFVESTMKSTEAALPEALKEMEAAKAEVGGHPFGSPEDKKQRDVARARSQRYHGMRSFVMFQKPRCERWSPQPLTPLPKSDEVETARKVRTGILDATRRLKEAKRVLSKLIDSFSCMYLQNTKVLGLPFNSDLYYSQPNSATVLKFATKVEATNPPMVIREWISKVRAAHANFMELKAAYEAIAKS